MLLMDDPPSCRTKNVAHTDSGMEKKTATVARRLPRNIRIISAGEEQADAAFMQQRFDGGAHEARLIEHHVGLHRRQEHPPGG